MQNWQRKPSFHAAKLCQQGIHIPGSTAAQNVAMYITSSALCIFWDEIFPVGNVASLQATEHVLFMSSNMPPGNLEAKSKLQ